MAGRIYLLNNQSELMPMHEAAYDSERLLQELLAKHPDLLAGEQINSEQPRRWLLVTREMAVPGEEAGAGRWSLDHLFLDQDAIPTLIEVKRSTDSRIRREVVGQMLDYAANAVAYWPVEEIKAKFEGRCEADGSDPSEELAELLGEDRDAGDFWQLVKTNLQAGRVRLVFVADDIPPELRRVVEFLNGQMDPAEVLAIEIRQFVGQDVKALVPRVLGQTEFARSKKLPVTRRREFISEEEFLSELDAECSPQEQQLARQVIALARDQGLTDRFKQSPKGTELSFSPSLEVWRGSLYPIHMRHTGSISFDVNSNRSDDEQKKLETLLRRHRITKSAFGFSSINLDSVIQNKAADLLLETLSLVIAEIKKFEVEPCPT